MQTTYCIFPKIMRNIGYLSISLIMICFFSACDGTTVSTTEMPERLPSPTSLASPTSTPAENLTPTPSHTPTQATTFLCPSKASKEKDWTCEKHPGSWTRSCTSTSPEQKWDCYEDLDYEVALNHPPNWRASIPMNTTSTDFAVVRRRHEIIGPEGAIDLDIWVTTEEDLLSWMEKMNRICGSDLFPLMVPNAAVGGHPAMIFIMGSSDSPQPMFTVFIKDGSHVFRLWHTILCREKGLSTLRRMLNSLRFSQESVPAEIPDDVWQKAVNICED